MAGKGKEPKQTATSLEIWIQLMLTAMFLGGARLYDPYSWIIQLSALATVGVYTAWLLVKTKPWREPNWTRRAIRSVALIAAALGAMFSVGMMLYDAQQYVLALVAVALIAIASAKYEKSARDAEDREVNALATRDAMRLLLEQTAEQENQDPRRKSHAR